MKQKVTVPNAERHIAAIAEFIEVDNPDAAARYVLAVNQSFRDLPDILVPARASEKLPKDVRKMPVSDFRGYTLRLLYRDDYIALIAAFRPGLTVAMQDRATRSGIDEFKEDYE